MVSRRDCLAGTGALFAGLTGCSGLNPFGGDGSNYPATTTGLSFSTPAFGDGETVPRRHTCEGENVSPPLEIGNVPPGAGSLAVLVDDPDAPQARPFVHWVLWNVAPSRTSIAENVPREEAVLDGAVQGVTDTGDVGYTGPCPPPDDGAHTYRFTCLAVEDTVDLAAGASKSDLLDAVGDRVVAGARFTGEFDR